MRSDVIHVSSDGAGFDEALNQAEFVARFRDLPKKSALQLRLLTEEVMGMMRALTGEREADFWIDDENPDDPADRLFRLHLTAETMMNGEMRKKLLSASTSGLNSAAVGFTGKLRDLFEQLIEPSDQNMADDLKMGVYYAGADYAVESVNSADLWSLNAYREEIGNGAGPKADWDELEKSVVAKVADEVRIGITGQVVEMTIYKKY